MYTHCDLVYSNENFNVHTLNNPIMVIYHIIVINLPVVIWKQRSELRMESRVTPLVLAICSWLSPPSKAQCFLCISSVLAMKSITGELQKDWSAVMKRGKVHTQCARMIMMDRWYKTAL